MQCRAGNMGRHRIRCVLFAGALLCCVWCVVCGVQFVRSFVWSLARAVFCMGFGWWRGARNETMAGPGWPDWPVFSLDCWMGPGWYNRLWHGILCRERARPTNDIAMAGRQGKQADSRRDNNFALFCCCCCCLMLSLCCVYFAWNFRVGRIECEAATLTSLLHHHIMYESGVRFCARADCMIIRAGVQNKTSQTNELVDGDHH